MRLETAKTARESTKLAGEFDALGVEPVFLKQDQAINHAQSRARFCSGEIGTLNLSEIERIIAFIGGLINPPR
jgi:hypothetical protein